MSTIADLLEGNQYILEMLASCLVVMIPHKKKEHFLRRSISAFVVAEVISMVIMNLPRIKDIWQGTTNIVVNCIAFCVIFPIVVCLYMSLCCPVSGKEELIYCAALSLCIQHFASDLQLCLLAWIPESGPVTSFLVQICSITVPYLAVYHFCLKKICENGFYQIESSNLKRATFVVVLIAAFVSVIAKVFQGTEENALFYVCQIYDMVCCVLLLWIQVNQKETLQLQHELDIQSYLKYLRREQYKQAKGDIDMMTHLMHDLAHQVAEMISGSSLSVEDELVGKIEANLMTFENTVNTKNETLNIVLKEYRALGRTNQISWMCVADGEQMDFMKTEDIYLIFHNALDNAVESVCALADPQRRIIDVKVFSKESFLMIQIENEFEGRLQFKNGLPVTTKEDKKYHGYGLKTIRQIAEQYMGCMVVQAKENRFLLEVMLPIPR